MKIKNIFSLFLALTCIQIKCIPQYYCTAADSKFYPHLLNLIGSIHRVSFNELGEIAVFDLGFTPEQRTELGRIDKLKVYAVEKTNPDILKVFQAHITGGRSIRGWFSWKPVAIKQALDMFPEILWIDAGFTILRPLDHLFNHIETEGYFFSTIGMNPEEFTIGWGCNKHIKDLFNLNHPAYTWILEKEQIQAGMQGISRKMYDSYVMPMYELTKDIRFFEDDGTAFTGPANGRHDQTIVGALVYLQGLTYFNQDVTQKTPMLLQSNGKQEPFYMTWDAPSICEKTHIYLSHHDLGNINYFIQCIKLKNN